MKKLLLSFVIVAVALFTNVMAKDNPRAIIIFDASGSMWGQINGVPKIKIAKDALKKVVKNWNPDIQLGLTVYGHRRKGDCNDIQSVVPVGAVDKGRIVKSVMAISPKGKTPISRAIKRAANELKFTEDKATIILISDGKETCDPDPCGTAKELKKQGIDFVAHVIGFNVDKATDKQLACIANATGGEYFSAKNADALNKAIKNVVKKVEIAKPKKLEYNIQITASESKESTKVEALHQIYKDIGGKIADKYEHLCESSKKEPCLEHVAPGKYIIVTSYHHYKIKTPVEVTSEENLTKINVITGQTGKIYATARETEGGKLVHAYCFVYNEDRSKYWGMSVLRKDPKKTAIQLPIGKYTLDCEYNKFKKKNIPAVIKAGETTQIDVVFPTFFLQSKCSNPNDRVSYEIYAKSGELVYDKTAPCSKKLKVTLDEGTYSIEDKVKDAKATANVKVSAKEQNSAVLDFLTQNHEAEIKADTPAKTEQKSAKSEAKTIKVGEKVINIEGLSDEQIKKLKDMQKMLEMFGKKQ